VKDKIEKEIRSGKTGVAKPEKEEKEKTAK
jgi:hypothetical protein